MATSAFSFSVSGRSVTFVNTNPGDENFWDFGDGNWLLSENPVHTYERAGSYSVGLTVVDFDGVATSQQTVVIGAGAEVSIFMEFDDLEFPISFTVEGTPFSTGPFLYGGTWAVYPKVVLTGPYSSAEIRNTATGVAFQLQIPIPPAATRVVEWIRDEGWSVVDEDGFDRQWELSLDSNLPDFDIRPQNLLAGQQQIDAYLLGISDDTRVSIEFHESFF